MHGDAVLDRSNEINTTLDGVEVSASGENSNQLEYLAHHISFGFTYTNKDVGS